MRTSPGPDSPLFQAGRLTAAQVSSLTSLAAFAAELPPASAGWRHVRAPVHSQAGLKCSPGPIPGLDL